nr:MAG TPA: tail protein [Herelleviridae sp.]
MGNVRIAILNTYDKVCAFMDNDAPETMHYYDDELHQYLSGAAHTFSFKTDASHEDSIYLSAGYKLAFQSAGKDYYLNIMNCVRDEDIVEIEAYSLTFELLNEYVNAYAASESMSFEKYLEIFDYEKTLQIGHNEVSDKSIKNEWTGTDTILNRLFSLANVFDAEIEFCPRLNDDYSLKEVVLNVYRKHTDTCQGMGSDRTDMILRYGVDVEGVTKTSDVTELYTAIRPYGKDDLTLAELEKTELDADGEIVFFTAKGDDTIRAAQSRDRFPSNLMGKRTDGYIVKIWNYDTDNVNVLYGQALAELKKNCEPKVTYDIKGYFDTQIGDTVTIYDEEYEPPLYLHARVTEQVNSFTDPARNKTVVGNVEELQAEVSGELLQKVQALLYEQRTYACSVMTDNGTSFKNGKGESTLMAHVLDGTEDISSRVTIQWYADGEKVQSGKTLRICAADISERCVYRFEAIDTSGNMRGFCEVTVLNVRDGENGTQGSKGEKGDPGENAILLQIESSGGNVFKNTNVSTELSIVIFYGTQRITDSATMKSVFGEGAYLQWLYQGKDDDEFWEIPQEDFRISENGFKFKVSPSDIYTKGVYTCDLIN